MTAADLRRIGQVLYGPCWQTALALALGVNGRTVRRWASGASPVPDTARAGLLLLLGNRAAEVGRTLAALGR